MEVLKTFIAHDGTSISYFGPQNPVTEFPSVLLLHGMASNATRWSEFVEQTSLHALCNVYRMDLRGRQHSLFIGRYQRSDWLEDITEFLLHLNTDKLVFIGHSMGAQIAQDFACAYPERCQGIVLIDPVFPNNLHGKLRLTQRFKWLARGLLEILLFMNKLGLHRRNYPHRDLHKLDINTRATLAANPQMRISDLYMSPTADLEYMPLSSYLQDLLSVVGPLCPPQQVVCPVRILLSAGASVSGYEDNLASIQRFGDHKIDIIEADHWLLTERPQQARLALEAFVKEIISHEL